MHELIEVEEVPTPGQRRVRTRNGGTLELVGGPDEHYVWTVRGESGTRRAAFREPDTTISGRHAATITAFQPLGFRATLDDQLVGEHYPSVTDAQAAITGAMRERHGLIPASDLTEPDRA